MNSRMHRSLRMDQLSPDALRLVGASCLPQVDEDGFLKVHLRDRQAARDFRTSTALASTCKRYRGAVREAGPSRVHFIGPPENGEHAAVVLGICRLFGTSIQSIVLERIPDIEESTWCAVRNGCPHLVDVFVYRCPSDPASGAMSMKGLESLLANVGGMLKRLRFCGTSSAPAATGPRESLYANGGRLLKCLTRVEQLVIDIGWFEEAPCHEEEECLCHPRLPNWSAVGLLDMTSRIRDEGSATAAKLKSIALSQIQDGEGVTEGWPFSIPYAADNPRKTLADALKLYYFWTWALMYSALPSESIGTGSQAPADWLNPITRGVCCFVQSYDPEHFCDAMWDSSLLDVKNGMSDEACINHRNCGPRPDWLSDQDSGRRFFSNFTTQGSIILEFDTSHSRITDLE